MVKRMEFEGDMDEREPLNAMVAENLKKTIIRKICKETENKTQSKDDFSPVFRQYLLALGAAFTALSSGMTAGYSAVLLPQLSDPESDLPITKDEGSWIASMAALPMMLGCLCSSYPMDKFGRRMAMIVSSVLFTAGWATVALSTDVTCLYVGRLLTGFIVGLVAPMCQVYIAEISDPQRRGILLSASPLAVAVGILAVHVIGTFLHWSTTAWICAVTPALGIVALYFVPESPLWLLGQSKMTEADISYRWFHGTSEESLQQWSDVLAKDKEAQTQQTEPPSKLALMLRPSFLKPFAVLNFLFFVLQFSGVNAVAFYSVTILKEVIPTINEYLATITIDVVRLIISVIGVLLLRTYGRKTLSVASAIGTAASLFLLSMYLALNAIPETVKTHGPVNSTDDTGLFMLAEEPEAEGFTILHCIPLLCLVSYICFVSIGIVPIPWILSGELFSKEMRGIGSGFTSSFGFICYFTVVKTSPDMFEMLGKAGTFSFFGAVCVVGSVVAALFLPETKDKTLLEIEAYYEKGSQEPMDNETGLNTRF